jgi:hypothetical protein
MTRQNVQWASEQVIKWMDEDPSLSWGEVWEALADCLDVDRVPVLDRIKIKEIVHSVIN